jgi:hypothetical protein
VQLLEVRARQLRVAPRPRHPRGLRAYTPVLRAR